MPPEPMTDSERSALWDLVELQWERIGENEGEEWLEVAWEEY